MRIKQYYHLKTGRFCGIHSQVKISKKIDLFSSSHISFEFYRSHQNHHDGCSVTTDGRKLLMHYIGSGVPMKLSNWNWLKWKKF